MNESIKKEIFRDVILSSDLTMGSKMVAAFFYLNDNETIANASYNDIAEALCMSRCGVIKAVKDLIQHGGLIKLQDIKRRRNYYSIPDLLSEAV